MNNGLIVLLRIERSVSAKYLYNENEEKISSCTDIRCDKNIYLDGGNFVELVKIMGREYTVKHVKLCSGEEYDRLSFEYSGYKFHGIVGKVI